MKLNFIILTDTACDLSFDYLKRNQVNYLGFTVTVDKKEYHTEKDDTLSPERLLQLINIGKNPITSQVNVGQFVEFFKNNLVAKVPILYLGFSSGLSGTYHSAVQAKELLKENYDTDQIILYDTKAAANGMGILIDRAVKMRDQGATIDQVLAMLDDLAPRVRSWFTVDNLHQLQRGGRVSKTTEIFGTMLNIKPVMDVDHDGKLRPISKVRGRGKAISYLVDRTVQDFDHGLEQKIFINYSGTITDARQAQSLLQEQLPEVTEYEINVSGPTITTHTGGGTLAIFSISTEQRS